MFIITNSLATLTLLLAALTATSTQEVRHCTMPNNENGTCIGIHICAVAQQLILLHDIQYLQKITCGFEGRQPLVCCPSDVATNPIQFNNSENATASPVHHTVPTQDPVPQSTVRTTTETRYFSERTKNEVTTPYTSPNEFANNEGNAAAIPTERATLPPSVMTSTRRVPTPAHALAVQSGLLPGRNECGVTAVVTRIYGGEIAAIDEFPWIARLKYLHERSKREMFACAGSLINRRYVLTAAHCLNSRDFKLVAVRLGEWDTEKTIDCDGEDCNDPVLDVDVEEVRIHSKFNSKRVSKGDIALLRLNHTVPYTDFIRPICLPTTEYIKGQDYLPDMTYVTAGWGRTETSMNSSLLRKVTLKAVEMEICKVALPNLDEPDQPFVICAGGRKGQDSCAGDSGGGLVRSISEEHVTNWFLLGMTSYGLRQCGSEGIPSVYTRIVPYMTWIVNNLMP